MDIQWIFFDVGYTLADETAVWKQRCREQAELPEAKALGLTPEDIFHDIEEASRQYKHQFRAVLEKYHFTQSAPYQGELEALYPDAVPVLKALSQKYSLGVIANQNQGLQKRLEEWGIAPYFSVVASSWDVGLWKPDPGLFRYALAQANCAPEHGLMVGDRLDNDIFPAKALGMKTLWLRNGFGALQTPKSPEYEPDFTADSLKELLLLHQSGWEPLRFEKYLVQ